MIRSIRVAKATRIFSKQFELRCANDRTIVVFMDLYKLPNGHPLSFPEGYRFSWIAFDPSDETAKVLFDCHEPKGPHIHVDSDSTGVPFEWRSLDDAYAFFFAKVRQRFGEFTQEEE